MMNEIELTDTHYKKDGKEYLRVTRVLSILPSELDKVPAHILEQAKTKGVFFHKSCQLYNTMHMQGRLTEPDFKNWLTGIFADSDIGEDFRRYVAWVVIMIEKFIAVEQQVVSDIEGIGGTLDIVAQEKGKKGLTLFDIKHATCWDFFKARLQTAAYVNLEPEYAKQISRRAVLQTKGIKTIKPVYFEPEFKNKIDWLLFLQVKNIYKAMVVHEKEATNGW